jgi:hypothetical protein
MGCAKKPIQFAEAYQAVLLDNGAVYFGKLEGLGTPEPVLREVYYVQQGVNQQTKEVTSVLIRRGQEWHSPDRMILNARHIVFVEPVGKDSRVAKLIEELKSKK